jgi:hypothetical protein
MKKTFNIAGPCHPKKHYMLSSQERCKGLMQLIDQEHYFVIHAGRQSGKTTLLLELTRQLNQQGRYYVLYCSLETVQGINEVEKGIPTIIERLKFEVEYHERLSEYVFGNGLKNTTPMILLLKALSQFCKSLDKPLVIFFDEVDCLSNGTLISFLRQLRDGYVNRYDIPFVHSIALVGMRNIRDYKGKISEEGERLGSASPFNIVKTSKTLPHFTLAEIKNLYAQHTQETGQVFAPEVIEKVYQHTQGQPWLVNAIACEIIEQILEFDFSKPIVIEQIDKAIQTLIKRRDTHIDSLMERLTEPRVQRIVEPVILGQSKGYSILDDDYQYVLDLGLLREVSGKIVPANSIYAEVIIRTLNSPSQMDMKEKNFPPQASAYYLDNGLNMKKLLCDFQAFWRKNSEIWVEKYEYQEAAPHLILQAFLQRVINGGGQISREMASGNGRLDLCLHYQNQDYPIELKLRYNEQTYDEGLKQLSEYIDKLDLNEGWLIVFDRRKRSTWKKKIFWKTSKLDGKRIHIVGC